VVMTLALAPHFSRYLATSSCLNNSATSQEQRGQQWVDVWEPCKHNKQYLFCLQGCSQATSSKSQRMHSSC
jgi:hypothetical protein